MAKRILVVDDEIGIRNLVRTVLEDEGYEVSVAADGRQAVEAAGEQSPDLVILDVMMPEVSGEDVVHELDAHADLRDTPVLLMSAAVTAPGPLETKRDMVFLAKPFELDQLVSLVHDLLE
jgi:DNA-binding response OmpR family regulator